MYDTYVRSDPSSDDYVGEYPMSVDVVTSFFYQMEM